MHILLMEFDLYLPGVHSLKEKRSIIKPLLNEIRRDYNVSAAEVEFHDQWQQARLAVVCLGNMRDALERIERSIYELMETHGDAQLSALNKQWL